ncbi:MAG: Ig-like domain-containing protein, partial [Phycisphaerae bacterium]
YDVAYNQTLNVSSNGILANDMAESGILTAALISPPQHGDITAFNSDGTFTYVPDVNYSGQDSFVYAAATANGSDQATVTITVHSNLEFSIILLPDVQNYYNYPAVLNTQTQWIADHKDEFNIAFVMTEGDFTNHNNVAEWSISSTAMSILDGEVPYAAVVGNHDTGSNMSTRNCSLFNQYFPASRFSSCLSGVYESNHMENSYHTFTAGGIDWLVFALEFGPRNKILDWANGIIDANPHRRVIIVTHNYMYDDDTRVGTGDTWNPHTYAACTSATGPEACNDGEEMWTNFVKLHENISFVFSGHILHDGIGTLVSTGDNGNSVYQMLANYQDQPNGGNGWLRIVTFYPEQQKVGVKTYSPYLGLYNTAADQQFEFTGVDLTVP